MVEAILRGKNTEVSVRTGGEVTPEPVGDITGNVGGEVRFRLLPLFLNVDDGRLSTFFSCPGEARRTGHL